MKNLLYLLLTCLAPGCSHGDKEREDFPAATQQGEKESNALIRDQNIEDTTTIHDTTPGVIKPRSR